MQFGLPLAACLFFFGDFLDFEFFFRNFWPNNISRKVSLLRPFLCLFMFKVINVFICNQTSICLWIWNRLVLYSISNYIASSSCLIYNNNNKALRFCANIFLWMCVRCVRYISMSYTCGYSLIYLTSKDYELVSVKDSESLNKRDFADWWMSSSRSICCYFYFCSVAATIRSWFPRSVMNLFKHPVRWLSIRFFFAKYKKNRHKFGYTISYNAVLFGFIHDFDHWSIENTAS